MNNLIKKLLFLPLLLWAVTVMAEQSIVPAMIVCGTNGNKQVVPLDATNVTDLIVLQNGPSLSVDIPETQISGVRSISFTMVAADEVTTDLNSTENPIVQSVEKVVHDGQVILRLLMQNGATIEYNIQGIQITTK